MLILRVGRLARWANRRPDDPLDLAEAARDLQLRAGEAGLSVFEVSDPADAERIAILFALHRKACSTGGRLDGVDYLVVPSEHFTALGLALVHVPDEHLPGPLAARHHEIRGMTPGIEIELARSILQAADFRAERLRKRTILERAAADEGLEAYLDPG